MKRKKFQVAKLCLNCGHDFYIQRIDADIPQKKERSCCSIHCARSFASKAKRKEINEKVSKTIIAFYDKKGRTSKKQKIFKCKTCQKPIGKNVFGYCQECYRKTPLYRENTRKGILKCISEGRHKGWTSRFFVSYAEKFFIKVLDENGFKDKYIHEYKIPKSNFVKESGNWFLDFFFEKGKVDLEIDGKQHDYPDRIIKDKIRDKILTENGYLVYRIKWKNITTESGSNYMSNEINKLLTFLRDVA